MRPELCFFENVEGHISLGLRDVIAELDRIGYATAWGIFSAAEVGAPHQRKRIFVLAHRHDTRLEGYHRLLTGREEPRRESPQPEGSVGGCDRRRDGEWPSRPGQPQYEWEPPRVVGNSNSQHRRASTERREHDPEAGSTGESMGNSHCPRPQEREGQGGPHVQRADSDDRAASSGPTQPPLGRDARGSTRGLDYAELCLAGDNRTDELRLLGNGVVPATCRLAFRTLLNEAHALQFSSGCYPLASDNNAIK
jgi:DNA (cytosine-5)-methyltransferase 1